MEAPRSMNLITRLTEAAKRPGIMGLGGMAIERRCRRDLEAYFRKLAAAVSSLGLENLADQPELLARHTAEMRLSNVLRKLSPDLGQILETNINSALLRGDKLVQVHEADLNPFPDEGIDVLGMTGEEAAAYAAEKADSLVKGINDTTLSLLQHAISEGITEMRGVPGTARLVKAALGNMTTDRAQTIASTEMNDAMSEATIRKIGRLGIGYLKWIAEDDACPICDENSDVIVLLGSPFPSGYTRTPAHPNCRCAIVGARAPEE